MWLIYLYLFLFGSCIGSFVNVAALRTAEGKSFVKGRSQCPHCGQTLRAYELIPVFSYIFLRGRCGHCKAKISPRYFFVEVASGLVFVFCFWWYGPGWEAAGTCLLGALLLCVFLVDMQAKIIPNGLIICFIAPAIIELVRTGGADIWGRVIGFFVVSAPLFLLTLLIPDCFGGGDIKLTAVCGFILGFRAMLLAAFLAIVSCGLIAGVRLVLKKVKKSDHIAFGPYLACSILFAKWFYAPIMAAYLSCMQL